jgi:hypothetical protein
MVIAMHRLALILLVTFACSHTSRVRAYECPGFFFGTLPSAQEGSYPPDRIVLWTNCVGCEGARDIVDVSRESEPVEGAAVIRTTGSQAFVIWKPSSPLEVGATYDLFRPDFYQDFNGTATIRPADDASDGRGADPFASIEWQLTAGHSLIERACCDDDYEESCGPSCAYAIAQRPMLEVSGRAAPWVVYWLSSEDTDVSADASVGPLTDASAWTLSATLRNASDELCVRLSALNLLTDEERSLDHCETIAPATSFVPAGWSAGWINGCASVPSIGCTDSGSSQCESAEDELAAAWCGTSIEQCRAARGELKADYCDYAAEDCAPFWIPSRDDAGTDAGNDQDAEVAEPDAGTDPGDAPPASTSVGTSGGCAVQRARHRLPLGAWMSVVVLATAFIRLRRLKTATKGVAILVCALGSSTAHAFDCPDLRLETLPTAEAGSYPPDRIVLRSDCPDCMPPLGLEVGLEGEPIEGTETVLTVGELAFVLWQPTEALEVGATYDLFRQGYDGSAFDRTATIRAANDASDGRGADPFAGIEWRLTERESVTGRTCCKPSFEHCEPDCRETKASRPVLEVSGMTAPWFVYRLTTEDFSVWISDALGPFPDVSTEWMFQATLQRPAQSLCVRLTALNLLTDEEEHREHCEDIDASASFEPGTWALDWLGICYRSPGIECGDPGGAECAKAREDVRDAWCASKRAECEGQPAQYSDEGCGDTSAVCASLWAATSDDAGANAETEDAAVSDASERDESSESDEADAGCAVDPSPERSRWLHASESLAVIALVLTRLRRRRGSHNS